MIGTPPNLGKPLDRVADGILGVRVFGNQSTTPSAALTRSPDVGDDVPKP